MNNIRLASTRGGGIFSTRPGSPLWKNSKIAVSGFSDFKATWKAISAFWTQKKYLISYSMTAPNAVVKRILWRGKETDEGLTLSLAACARDKGFPNVVGKLGSEQGVWVSYAIQIVDSAINHRLPFQVMLWKITPYYFHLLRVWLWFKDSANRWTAAKVSAWNGACHQVRTCGGGWKCQILIIYFSLSEPMVVCLLYNP